MIFTEFLKYYIGENQKLHINTDMKICRSENLKMFESIFPELDISPLPPGTAHCTGQGQWMQILNTIFDCQAKEYNLSTMLRI